MKIGILTFHWATNYGAVLQAYCLQEYLKEQGHEVEIINYKPRHFDFVWRYLRRPWLLMGLRKDLVARKKEQKLVPFRLKRLNMTKRYYTTKEMLQAKMNYDVVISGSDQVLNPSYTLSGENRPASAYYLTFAENSRRVGYAVSFGCTEYPAYALKYARKWINSFDAVGVRENTGLGILDQMNFNGEKQVVPDPTILYGKNMFEKVDCEKLEVADYLCVYSLRTKLNLNENRVIQIDELNNPISMEQWLGTIIHAQGLITDSYHGMIMAILNHVPFVALKALGDSAGMNDRFTTLLERLGLENRIVDVKSDYHSVLEQPIDWEDVEEKLNGYRRVGIDYLSTTISI